MLLWLVRTSPCGALFSVSMILDQVATNLALLFVQVSLIEPPTIAILTRAGRLARASRARGFTALRAVAGRASPAFSLRSPLPAVLFSRAFVEPQSVQSNTET